MKRRNGLTTLCLLCACLLGSRAPAQTPPPSEPQAAAHRARAKERAAKGDIPGVLAEYQQAYDLDKDASLRDAALDLGHMGAIYDILGQYAPARECYQRTLLIERQLGNRKDEATMLNNIGLDDLNLGQRHPALENLQRALPIERQLGDEAGEAVTLNNVGAVLQSLNRPAQALEVYQQAFSIAQAAGDKADETGSLNGVGICCLSLSRYPQALAAFGQELEIERQLGNAADEAKTLNNLGRVYVSLGQYPEAIDLYDQALALLRQVGDTASEAVTLSNLGLASKDQGQYDQSLEFYRQAQVLEQKLGDRAGEATTRNNIGITEVGLGRYAQALDDFQQNLPIWRQTGDKMGEAVTLNNLGGVYDNLGQPARALGFYQQALPILRQIGDRAGEAGTLNNIGRVYDSQGRYPQARGCYQQALAIERKIGDSLGEAATLNNIGLVYDDGGQGAKAIVFYRQALTLEGQMGARDREALTRSRLGLAYTHLGRFTQALALYDQALPALSEVGDRSGEAATLRNLMLACRGLHRTRLAIWYGKQAVNTYQSIRAGIQTLDRQAQKSYLSANADTYRTLAELLISQGRLPEAQQVLGLLKDQELRDFVQRDATALPPNQATVPLTPDERADQDRYQQAADPVTALGAQIEALRRNKNRTPAEDKTLTDLQAQVGPAQQTFQAFLTALPQELADTPSDTQSRAQQIAQAAGGLQRALRDMGPGTVALYTLVEPDRYRVVVVTSQVEKAEDFPIKAADLRAKVAQFQQALRDPRLDPRPLGQELYHVLMGPIEKDLAGAGAKTLMWSLDDVLRYIPVGALYDGRRYVTERYDTEVFTGASLPLLSQKAADWTVLALGVSKAHTDFPALPGVPQEMSGIVKGKDNDGNGVLDGAELLDEQFTQTAMMAGLNRGYPVVHIASHFALGPDYASSYLLLGDGAHLSLAQINGGGQVFQDVDLLTLSACETAVGGRGGDGHEIESFGMMAQDKGAASILASLWPVSDASTQILMRLFYRRHQTQPAVSKAEALRQAQLSLLRGTVQASESSPSKRAGRADEEDVSVSLPLFTPDPKAPYAHPYYWAPFVLIGNWK